MAAHKNRSLPTRFGFAWQGLRHALRTEASLRLQAVCLVVAVGALAVLRPHALWWALVLLASAEALADELHPHHSPGVRRAKDCAAAGVLLAALGALAVAVALAVQLLRGAAPAG